MSHVVSCDPLPQDMPDLGINGCPLNGADEMDDVSSFTEDVSCDGDSKKRKAEACELEAPEENQPRQRICRPGDVNCPPPSLRADVQAMTAAVHNQLQIAPPVNAVDVLGNKCRELICGLKSFGEFIGQLAMNTFTAKPRLQQRLLIAFWMIKSEAKVQYTAYHLYILRVCELLILACLKPAVEAVMGDRQDLALIERLRAKVLFWKRPECGALIGYLTQHCRQAPQCLNVLRAMPSVMNQCHDLTQVSVLLGKLSAIEGIVKSAMSRRIADLQRMIGAATGNASGAASAVPSTIG